MEHSEKTCRPRTALMGALLGAGLLLLVATITMSEAQTADLYVGVENCKKCHEYQYQVWKNSTHARATTMLTAGQKQDMRCGQCHITAPPSPTSDKAISGITCEHCHGQGRYYHREYVMRDKELAAHVGLVAKPDEQSCLVCHGEGAPNIRPFTIKDRWPLIDHQYQQ